MGKGEDEWLLHAGLGTLGKADATRIVLESADLDSAEKITFAHPGVTVLVGGNNVGKSTLLRELVDSIRGIAGGTDRYPGGTAGGVVARPAQ